MFSRSLLFVFFLFSFCLTGCGGGGLNPGGSAVQGPGPGGGGSVGFTVDYGGLPQREDEVLTAILVNSGSASNTATVIVDILDPATETAVHPTTVVQRDPELTRQTIVIQNIVPGTHLVRLALLDSEGNPIFVAEELASVNVGQVTQVAFTGGGGGGGGGSATDLIAQGLEALTRGTYADYVLARNLFQQAVAIVTANGQQDNEAATAHFFYAITRVGALAAELPSDGAANGLNTVGDFLDAFGFAPNPRTTYSGLMAPMTFPPTSPTAEDVRLFLATRVRQELEGAIDNLNQIPPSFQSQWSFNDVAPGKLVATESDFGDVLAIRGAFRGVLAGVIIMTSYDLGDDIATQLNDPGRTLENILLANPNAGNHVDTSSLPAAQTQLSTGIDDIVAAINFIQAESDPQDDDLINLASLPAGDVNEFLSESSTYKSALTGLVTTQASDGSMASLFLPDFFDADGVDLRPFAPPVVGDDPAGLFQNNPFSPVYFGFTPGTHADPNLDVNPADGIPDILQ